MLAEICRLEKNFSYSKELLFTARNINPRNSNTYYNLSLLYKDIGSLDESLKYAEISIKRNPENYIYKLLKADLFKNMNNLKASREILENLDYY